MQALHTCVGLRFLDLRFLEITPLGRGGQWCHFDGLSDLLRLRGIEGLVVRKDEGGLGVVGEYEGWEELLVALQVVRGPRGRGLLGRQYDGEFLGIGVEGGGGEGWWVASRGGH